MTAHSQPRCGERPHDLSTSSHRVRRVQLLATRINSRPRPTARSSASSVPLAPELVRQLLEDPVRLPPPDVRDEHPRRRTQTRAPSLPTTARHTPGSNQGFDRAVGYGVVNKLLQSFAFENPTIWNRPIAEFCFVKFVCQFLQFETIVSRSIECTNDSARAGANDDVGCNALRFQYLDYANVRETTRGATTEGNADLDRLGSGLFCRAWRSCLCGCNG